MLDKWSKKEKPVFTGITRGVGGFGFGGGSAAPGPGITPNSATGGTKITDGGYIYHVFVSNTPFQVASGNTPVEVLVIGGGAAGGRQHGGGGGAGSVVHATNQPIAPGTYSVTVGDGGNHPWPGGESPGGDGQNGVDSAFGSSPNPIYIIAKGGGGGAGYQRTGVTGGSGGGASHQTSPTPATAPPTSPSGQATTDPAGKSYQNIGAGHPRTNGGGGGGSGGAGQQSAPGNPAGVGGAGQAFPGFPGPVLAPGIPSPVRPGWTPVVGPTGVFAGGGGGGGHGSPSAGGAGGTGGGGGGGSYNNPEPSSGTGSNGIEYTGAGGGGGGSNDVGAASGGYGIIIVKYAV